MQIQRMCIPCKAKSNAGLVIIATSRQGFIYIADDSVVNVVLQKI